MTENPAGPTSGAKPRPVGIVGRLVIALGAVTALVVWLPRAAFSIDGGFEHHARDLSVVFVDLPLILLGCTAVPFSTWTLTTRWGRPP
ncbi:hypothetical protein ABZ934_06230 [Streptomyces sp. NPDC046557]|uniref:hypothetical protein n=1 Tax=Streptomyces sp. NPDC046557 TaxID=3155372 RepID=UPI0033E6958E